MLVWMLIPASTAHPLTNLTSVSVRLHRLASRCFPSNRRQSPSDPCWPEALLEGFPLQELKTRGS